MSAPGMGLMMLAKTIVVVSEHVNARLLGGRLARDRQHRPATRPDDRRGADGRSRPRRAPPPLWRQARRRRDGEERARRRPGLARRDRDDRRDARAASPDAGRNTVSEQDRRVLEAIKFEHTVFALPFAYIAMVPRPAAGPAGGRWAGTAAMVGGRTCAMAANRVIDRFIDARKSPDGRAHLAGRAWAWARCARWPSQARWSCSSRRGC